MLIKKWLLSTATLKLRVLVKLFSSIICWSRIWGQFFMSCADILSHCPFMQFAFNYNASHQSHYDRHLFSLFLYFFCLWFEEWEHAPWYLFILIKLFVQMSTGHKYSIYTFIVVILGQVRGKCLEVENLC